MHTCIRHYDAVTIYHWPLSEGPFSFWLMKERFVSQIGLAAPEAWVYLHNTADIIPGAAHLQYSRSILNLSGVCSSPSPSKPLRLCIYSLHPLIHSKTCEHCLPGGSSPSHYPNLPFYPLFSFGQWIVCLCLSGVAVIRHNSDCGCVVVLGLLFSLNKAVCICVCVLHVPPCWAPLLFIICSLIHYLCYKTSSKKVPKD